MFSEYVHIDLFSGIGGFALGALNSGIKTKLFCDVDPENQRHLNYHFPKIPIWDDIKTLNKEIIIEKTLLNERQRTIITGGFPCQPFSISGKRKGEKDERYLWEENLRIISEIKPAWIISENVRGLTSINNGETIEKICTSLEGINYQIQPFILSSGITGSPQQRERVWIIGKNASNANNFLQQSELVNREDKKKTGRSKNGNAPKGKKLFGKRIWDQSCTSSQIDTQRTGESYRLGNYERLQTEPPLCRVSDGLSNGLDKNSWKTRHKQLGNSINPEIALLFFEAIKKYDKYFIKN